MEALRRRLQARLQWCKTERKAICNFGLKLWIIKKFTAKIYPRNRKIGIWLNERKHELILKYIDQHYGSQISLEQNMELGNVTENCTIWTCWWTGEGNAPDIVRACFRSVRQHAGKHRVIVISWDNYREFVDIPERIVEKYREKKILPAHMADLLRCKLLEKYGGIWCDATIFLTADIDPRLYNYPFFTIKHHLEYEQKLELEPSKCFWRIFFMAACKDNPLLKMTGEILERWLLSDTPLINYWTMDYIFLLIYQKNEFIREMLDRVPYNNEYPYFLQNHINDILTDDMMNVLATQSLHKLSWKDGISELENSVYQRIIKSEYIDAAV